MDTTNPLLAPLLVTLAFLAACLVRLHVEGVLSARRRKTKIIQSPVFRLLEDVLREMRDLLHDEFNGGSPGPQPYLQLETILHDWLEYMGCRGEPMSLQELVLRNGESDLRKLRIDDGAFEYMPHRLLEVGALVEASNDEVLRMLWKERTVLSIITMLRVCHTARWRQIVHGHTLIGRLPLSPESAAKWRSVKEMWKQLSLAYEELDEPQTRTAMEHWRAQWRS